MWKVISFATYPQLQDYLNANSVPQAKVVSVLPDAANGGFILIIAP